MALNLNPCALVDAYKFGHLSMNPVGTQFIQANMTARGSRVDGVRGTVFFGLQYAIQRHLMDEMSGIFLDPSEKMFREFADDVNHYLGHKRVGSKHIEALCRLGYVPLQFSAWAEGSVVPLRMPMWLVENTNPEFAWCSTYFETILSNATWKPITNATTAARYRTLLDGACERTGGDPAFVDWQAHDFSFRGMSGLDDALSSGAAHLLSFKGSDTFPAVKWIRKYYPGSPADEIIAGSVDASEHSCMMTGGPSEELETFEHIMSVCPDGIVSIVSDTWSLSNVVTNLLPKLRERILTRNGKLVIRPDSSPKGRTPADILCGDPTSDQPFYRAGLVRALHDQFPGPLTNFGYKQLDPHIGCIYGDSITHEISADIVLRLREAGFASTIPVLGIGSYTYQYVTRDTYEIAVKATHAVVNGESRDLFKRPETDGGTKFSASGRLAIQPDADRGYRLIERASPREEAASRLQPVWRDGKWLREPLSFSEVRKNLRSAKKMW